MLGARWSLDETVGIENGQVLIVPMVLPSIRQWI